MQRRRHRLEKEEKNRRSHNHSERETTEDNRDRLSDLPICILIHILSFLQAKDAVRTCILSSTWQHLWKHLPSLTLYSSHFTTVEAFMNFVNGILSLRETPLIALDFDLEDFVEPHVLESIVSFAASLNVNQLRLSFDLPACPDHHFPSFSSHFLTSLDIGFEYSVPFPNSLNLNLPALTYLKLQKLFFYAENNGRAEPFSNFKRLNTLILHICTVQNTKPLCISSTTLLNLSIHTAYGQCCSDIELFAPSLCTFAVFCLSFQKLFGSHLSSIKQVSIDIYNLEESSTLSSIFLLNWLTQMTNIKSLTITPRALQALSLFHDIFKLKLTSWCNLKSLQLNFSHDQEPTVS